MKIRSQLALLVVAVVVPVALLAAATTARLWTLQREAYEQRYLERVSALRLALDTRLDATTRLLRGLSGSGELDDPVAAAELRRALRPAAAGEPGVGDGRPARRPGPAGRGAHPRPARRRSRRRAATPEDGVRPVFSDLRDVGGGTFVTYVSVPVLRAEASRGSLYVAITQHGWLEFLRSYPVSARATLTLNDRQGLIIARTLNPERWVGRRSRTRFPRADPHPRRGRVADPRPRGAALLYRVQPLARLRLDPRHRRAARGGRGVAARLDAGDARRRHRHRARGRAVRGLDRLAHHRRDHRPLARRRSGSRRPARRRPRRRWRSRRPRRSARRSVRHARSSSRATPSAMPPTPARRLARAEAEQSNAAKDEFLAMLGHELRNPLSAMKSASALLGTPGVRRRCSSARAK